jgi:hypothetical protein
MPPLQQAFGVSFPILVIVVDNWTTSSEPSRFLLSGGRSGLVPKGDPTQSRKG